MDMCSSEAVAQSLPLPVLARVQAEAGMPFNMLQGPLVRALLVKLGSSDHLMLLTMHHAVCDGWSFKVTCQSSACFAIAHCTCHCHCTGFHNTSVFSGSITHWNIWRLHGESPRSLNDLAPLVRISPPADA